MIGDGDSFSTSGAEIFELEATNNGIDICMKANYEAGSLDMKAPIKQIMENRCCLVTVLFGQDRDIYSLLLEAHRQNYTGEWVMSENVIGGMDGIIESLKKDLNEPAIHKLLRGMFECIWKQALHFPKNGFPSAPMRDSNHSLYNSPSISQRFVVHQRIASTQTHKCIIPSIVFRYFDGVSQTIRK